MDRFSIYPLNIKNTEELRLIIDRIGADPRCNLYFQPKRHIRHIYITHADFRAAAYIKQELLARGGDAVVGKHVIDAKASHSDVLLLGTEGQLSSLLFKMQAMDCWGLKEIREHLRAVLKNIAITGWSLPLPRGRKLDLGTTTQIMGILNLTPDSFHADSRVLNVDDLLKRAEKMLCEGADILDLGAESTRPGSAPLSSEEELLRLLPALKALRNAFPDAIISIDTYKGKVAYAAAESGADIINDISGFSLDNEMTTFLASTNLPYVLSHIRGAPSTMHNLPPCPDLLGEIHLYFQGKINQLESLGLRHDRIILDPGLGFAKKAQDNLLIIKELESLKSFGLPLMIGHSRKKFTRTLTGGEDALNSLIGTVALSALLEGRTQILRVHDVHENKLALRMAQALRELPL